MVEEILEKKRYLYKKRKTKKNFFFRLETRNKTKKNELTFFGRVRVEK